MTQIEEQLQPNNLFNLVKKGKNLHRRVQSSNSHDFDTLLNNKPATPNLMAEIAREQGVADTAKTLKAVETSATKQEEKHVTIEDIDEIPTNTGWIVPKNPYSKNPMQAIKKRDPHTIQTHTNDDHFETPKKLERFSDQQHLDEITGLSTVLERNQSIESSEIDPKELTSEKSLEGRSCRSHTRRSSCHEPTFSRKGSITQNTPQNIVGYPLSNELEKETAEGVGKKPHCQKQQVPTQADAVKYKLNGVISQDQKYQAMKVAKEKYHLSKKITPQAARNFLKVLDKHQKALPERSLQKPMNDRIQKPIETLKLEKNAPVNEEIQVFHKLESKIDMMSTKVEHLNQKTSLLMSQVADLRNIVTILTKEHNNYQQVIIWFQDKL